MDVLVLIDKLDDLVHNAKAVPLTDQVRIDREEIYDILDQMRATIPEEIKQARWIVKERQDMLAEAKREVDRLLAEAREQAVREASQTEIVKLAERQAQDIVDEARRQARETRLEMEDWADGILSTLEVNSNTYESRNWQAANSEPDTLTVTVAPVGECSSAFSIRLSSTWSSRWRVARAGAAPSARATSTMCSSSAYGTQASTRERTMSVRSTSSGEPEPSSARASTRSPVTSRDSRCTSPRAAASSR